MARHGGRKSSRAMAEYTGPPSIVSKRAEQVGLMGWQLHLKMRCEECLLSPEYLRC